MQNHIDLNADLGEGEAYDAEIMALVSSCNIACGGHAGTSETMVEALDLAQKHNVRVGAHPSYPDLQNFGRKSVEIALDTLGASISDQIATLATIANERGQRLTHVKPHGALYNDAALKAPLAETIAICAVALGPDTHLVGPPGSALEEAATRAGLRFVGEGFVDRAYQRNGQLVPRTQAGAVLEDIDRRLNQAMSLVRRSEVTSIDGATLPLPVDTLCVHGDSPGALETARALRQRLMDAGIKIQAPT